MAKGFNGVPGGNIQGLMQQAQRMQKDMQKAQVEAEAFEAEEAQAAAQLSAK